jgi:hypothetical protein
MKLSIFTSFTVLENFLLDVLSSLPGHTHPAPAFFYEKREKERKEMHFQTPRTQTSQQV